jgi:hypothetical protein
MRTKEHAQVGTGFEGRAKRLKMNVEFASPAFWVLLIV